MSAIARRRRRRFERRVAIIEKMGCGIGWSDGDLGHGRAYRFPDPDGHVFELYYDTRRYEAPPAERPALKNIAQRYHGRGVGVRRHRSPQPARDRRLARSAIS